MNVTTLLDKWGEAKKTKSEATVQCEEYKAAAKRYMEKKGINTLDGTNYTVSKRSNSRKTLVKERLPVGMWEKCSVTNTYDSYYLTEK